MIEEIELSALRSDRTTRARIAILLNMDMLLHFTRVECREPSFWTFTYATTDSVKQMALDWSTFLRRLRKRVPLAGIRVFELGRKNGRFHVHAVFDRHIPIPVVEACKHALMLGHSHVERVADENLARYLYKEFNKQIGRRDIPGRQWACFGKLPEPWVTMNEIDLGLPWQEFRSRAFLTKEVGEPIREVMLRAFKDWLNSETPGLAVLRDGELYITDVHAMYPEPPARMVRAPLKPILHIVDPEIAAMLPEDDPDRDLDSYISYSYPNPYRRPDAIPVKKPEKKQG